MNEQKDIEYLAEQEEAYFFSLSIEERTKYTRIWQNSVFYANKPQCDHKETIAINEFELAQIEVISCIEPQIEDGFIIKEGICALCGKTLCLCIEKGKEVEKIE